MTGRSQEEEAAGLPGMERVLCLRDEPRFYRPCRGQRSVAGGGLSEVSQAKGQCVADVAAKHRMSAWGTGQRPCPSGFPSCKETGLVRPTRGLFN